MFEHVVLSGRDYRCESASEEECALVHELLSGMVFYKSYDFVVITETLKVVKDDRCSFLALLNFNYTVKPVKYPLHEINENYAEVIGIVRLTKDYGRVFIRPETIEDIISDYQNGSRFCKRDTIQPEIFHPDRSGTTVEDSGLFTLPEYHRKI